MEKKRLGNSDMEITPDRGRRVGHGRRRLGVRLGAAGRQRVDRGHSRRPRRRRQLDRYGRRLRPGTFRRSGGAGAARAGPRPYVFTKCERVWDEKGEIGGILKADSVRRECEASLRRLKVDAIDLYQIHWPEPDEDIEEGWGDHGQAERGRQGALDRRLEFQRRRRWSAAAPIAPVTSLQPPYSAISPGGGGRDPALLPAARHRRDRLFAHEIGPAHRQDDQGARGRFSAGRFPRPRAGLPGAATLAQPGAGRS